MAVFCVLPDKYRMAVRMVVNWSRYTKATSERYVAGSFRFRSASHAGAVLQVVGAGLLGPIRVDGGLVATP